MELKKKLKRSSTKNAKIPKLLNGKAHLSKYLKISSQIFPIIFINKVHFMFYKDIGKMIISANYVNHLNVLKITKI